MAQGVDIEPTWISSVFRRLHLEIRQLEVTRPAQFARASTIPNSFAFLKSAQNSDGSWGSHALFETNLALRAIGLWSHQIPELRANTSWVLPTGAPGGVDLAFEWLVAQQVGGCWEGNIWDTAGVVRAASLHQRASEPFVNSAVAWLDKQAATDWGLKAGLPPHYAAQALLAYNDVGATDNQSVLVDLLYAEVKRQPDLAARSVYIAGQVVEALVESGVSPAERPMREYVASLTSRIDQIEVSSANFLDIACGFLALGVIHGGVDEKSEIAQRTLASMLQPSRLRPNGSWYQNVLFTSWALVALSRVARVITLEAVPLELYTMLARARDEIASGARQRLAAGRRATVLAVLVGVLTASAAWVVAAATAGPVRIDTSNNLVWWVMGVLVSAIALVFRLSATFSRKQMED